MVSRRPELLDAGGDLQVLARGEHGRGARALLRPAAIRYWARTMRSPAGELCFAAHWRHTDAKTRALGSDMAA